MTIGIGVLASENVKPDSLIMISDTMGSFEDAYSTSELHKLHAIPSEEIYSVSSDLIDRAGEQINMLMNVFSRDYPSPRTYPDILRALVKTASMYKDLRFQTDALPRFRMGLDDWFKVQDPEFRKLLLIEYQNFYVGCQTLVGTFGENGQAYLFNLPGDGTVHNCTFPGFAAVGSGANNAVFWLSHRKHKFSCSVKRSAYHAYEAKRMAESSPHVNERIDMVIARKGKHFLFHQDKQEIAGAAVSVPELKKMFKKFNIRDTGALDPEDQSSKRAFGQDEIK
jgi:hypothetical protein